MPLLSRRPGTAINSVYYNDTVIASASELLSHQLCFIRLIDTQCVNMEVKPPDMFPQTCVNAYSACPPSVPRGDCAELCLAGLESRMRLCGFMVVLQLLANCG